MQYNEKNVALTDSKRSLGLHVYWLSNKHVSYLIMGTSIKKEELNPEGLGVRSSIILS